MPGELTIGLVPDVTVPRLTFSRLRVAAAGGQESTRFLHPISEGVDADGTADGSLPVESSAGTPMVSGVVNGAVVLFPVDLGAEVTEVTYTVPGKATRQAITGLVPGGSYDAELENDGDDLVVTIRTGSDEDADNGGVLLLMSGNLKGG